MKSVLEGTDVKEIYAMLQQYNRNPDSRKIEVRNCFAVPAKALSSCFNPISFQFSNFLSSSLRKLGRVQKEPPKDIVTSMDRSLARKRPNWRGLSSLPSGTTPPQHEQFQAAESKASSKTCDRDGDDRDV